MCEEVICEHVLAQRRASVCSITSRDSVSIGVLPSVPLPGRTRRHSSVRRASVSSPAAPLPDIKVCPVCGHACLRSDASTSRGRPRLYGAASLPTSPSVAAHLNMSPPPLDLRSPSSPIKPPHSHSPSPSPHNAPYHQHELSLAPRTSPVPEDAERNSGETSSTKVSDVAAGLKKITSERRRDKIFRYLPKSESSDNFDVESQEEIIIRTWNVWANESVQTSALVPALVMQALATGLLDATTYADFKTFASNQTGNAILLTVAAVGTATIILILTAVSFGSFLLGAFLFGQIGHFVGVRRRAWLLLSTSIQTMCLVVACILLSPHGPAVTHVGGPHEWVILSLFALMSGSQVAMARQSSCQELPTAPMTSTFVDFVADHYLFASWNDPKATSRNRRLYYVIAMIGGSFLGAVMHRWSSSWVVAVVAIGVKLVALTLIALAKPDGCYDGAKV